ncbi:sulfite exporter TauE/SafE family protein [Flavobacteriaceae bacterium F08102]|nr:sulfite exporter TauE/SafE family protein [Flavobacteriaceae bacterium F08102]
MAEMVNSIFEVVLTNGTLLILFFIVAVCYASVGFGGGSSYLALLALSTIPYVSMRAIALLCNVVVVSGSTVVFTQQKLLPWKKVILLVSWSVPLAFIGGYLRISQVFFYVLLGLTLMVAAIAMWMSKRIAENPRPLKSSLNQTALIGGGIGFISGMVGIGGGIFLAPVLHLTQWDHPKRIAGTASFFILVNSMAGLVGQFLSNDFQIDLYLAGVLMGTVFIGGQIGARLGSSKLSPRTLKKITAVLIFFVGCKLLYQYVFSR